jgi:hypothetical protein
VVQAEMSLVLQCLTMLIDCLQVALFTMVSSVCMTYVLQELLCGFIIPGPAIPVYIKWLYWAVSGLFIAAQCAVSPSAMLSSRC